MGGREGEDNGREKIKRDDGGRRYGDVGIREMVKWSQKQEKGVVQRVEK